MALIRRAVTEDRWHHEALVDERQSLSWQQVDAILNRATNGILDGVPPDRRVGVFARNCVEVALSHTAALAAGRSSVPINSFLADEELAYILDDACVDLLLTGPECLDVAKRAVGLASHVEIVAWRSDDSTQMQTWDAWLGQQSTDEPPTDMAPLPHLHYTSGTTGRPKGVETPPAMFPACDTVDELFAVLAKEALSTPSAVCLATAPLYHTSPMRLIRAFAGGAKLVTQERFDAEAFLAAIEKHRVERSVLVPTHFRRLLALDGKVRSRYDLSSLKFISHTGAACPSDVKEAMIAWIGPIFVEFYGGTETGPVAKIDSVTALKHPGSVGQAAPPFEAIIVDDEGHALPTGEEGRLFFYDTSGRGIIYANDPEKTRAAHIAPATFTLGDMGYIDADGFIFITDRASDMIVSGGVNIYPAEIEQVLIRYPGVDDVAVIGVPNHDMGESVKALIVLEANAKTPDSAELDQFCRSHLAAYKCPRTFDIVTSVGRNSMGKINKRELRRPYWPTDRTIG